MYIWQNGREGEPFVEERLDKACASLKWSKLYPAAKVRHLTASYSDHNPIVINTNPMHHQQIRRKQKLHRFEEKWVAHPECEEVVRDSWIHTQPSGSPMYCLFKKIKRYRAQLVAWGKSTFNDTKARLTEKQRELEELVKQGYAPNLECIKLLRREVNELIHHEEVFGGSGLGPYGFREVIKIPDSFTKGLAKERRKIPLMDSIMKMGCGKQMREESLL